MHGTSRTAAKRVAFRILSERETRTIGRRAERHKREIELTAVRLTIMLLIELNTRAYAAALPL